MTKEKTIAASGLLVRVSAKAMKDGAGFTDPATGFTISPGQEKALGRRIGALTRARLASGFLIRVEKPSANGGSPPPTAAEKKEEKKKFFGKGRKT
jgi:hypothetical protein